MESKSFFKRWRSRYRVLIDHQAELLKASRRHGTIEDIHQLRVALRRLRVMVSVCRPLLPKGTAKAYLNWSRGIATATSRLRDCDAALEWLRSQPNADKWIRRIETRRKKILRLTRKRLKTPPKSTLRALPKLGAQAASRERLLNRYLHRIKRLEQTVIVEAPRYREADVEQRHALRKIVRRLRYLRELALPCDKHSTDAYLHAMLKPQAAMGERQNLLLAESILRQVSKPDLPPDLARTLTRALRRYDKTAVSEIETLVQFLTHGTPNIQH